MDVAKLVVVTGAAGAIGAAIASRLARENWGVVGVDLKESPDRGPYAAQIVGDVARVETWQSVKDEVERLGAKLHGLVHCAALQVCKPFIETSLSEWRRVMDINLGGVYLGCHELHKYLAAGQGNVVGIGSVHARATSADISAYAASKGGLSALLRALAIEWARDGIRVNAVLPGAVDSQMLREGLARRREDVESGLAALAKKTVLGRIGFPEEIAEAVGFLLDNKRSGFITGTELVVDGGATIRLSTE